MAIIEDLGLAVSVRIDKSPLAEYDPPESDTERDHICEAIVTTVVDKYIESRDAEYDIKIEVLPQHQWLSLSKDNLLRFDIHIDGKLVEATLFDRKDLKSGYYKEIMKGVRRNTSRGGQLHRFRFDTITTFEEADKKTIADDMKRGKDMGSIRVKVWRECLKEVPSSSPSSSFDEAKANLSIVEKALKGKQVSHGTNFSPAEDTAKHMVLETVKIDKYPYAVFCFRYRSKAALRDEMIVPRTPSPSPSQVVNELDQDELRRLAKEKLIEMRTKLVELRTKREQDRQEVKQEVKQETQPRAIKREHGEAFDLNADDDDNSSRQPPAKMVRLNDGTQAFDLTDD